MTALGQALHVWRGQAESPAWNMAADELLLSNAAALGQAGRFEIRHQTMFCQLVKHDVRTPGYKLVEPTVDLWQPVIVKCPGATVARLAIGRRPTVRGRLSPARRFADHGQAQLVNTLVEQRRNRLWSKRTAVVEMLVQPIRHRLTKLGVVQALLPARPLPLFNHDVAHFGEHLDVCFRPRGRISAHINDRQRVKAS